VFSLSGGFEHPLCTRELQEAGHVPVLFASRSFVHAQGSMGYTCCLPCLPAKDRGTQSPLESMHTFFNPYEMKGYQKSEIGCTHACWRIRVKKDNASGPQCVEAPGNFEPSIEMETWM